VSCCVGCIGRSHLVLVVVRRMYEQRHLQLARVRDRRPLEIRLRILLERSAEALLRRNLILYGVGGIVAPFLGIKLIDILITALHLA